jgi:hypothetical protein
MPHYESIESKFEAHKQTINDYVSTVAGLLPKIQEYSQFKLEVELGNLIEKM